MTTDTVPVDATRLSRLRWQCRRGLLENDLFIERFFTEQFVHTARRTIISLIFPIAFVGFKPFGQTSTQFMIVWQRNNR